MRTRKLLKEEMLSRKIKVRKVSDCIRTLNIVQHSAYVWNGSSGIHDEGHVIAHD
jgi:uncharacterized protein involved in tolerance to divalent cations